MPLYHLVSAQLWGWPALALLVSQGAIFSAKEKQTTRRLDKYCAWLGGCCGGFTTVGTKLGVPQKGKSDHRMEIFRINIYFLVTSWSEFRGKGKN